MNSVGMTGWSFHNHEATGSSQIRTAAKYKELGG